MKTILKAAARLLATMQVTAATMKENIAKLQRSKGHLYSKITNAKGESGWLGFSGAAHFKVYFVFYPDGTFTRHEKPITEKDLKSGWTAEELRDPETVAKDKAKADKVAREYENEKLLNEPIRLSFDELTKVCAANNIRFGKIADAYPESLDGDADDEEKIDGVWINTTTYCIAVFNEDYAEDDEDSQEIHDSIYVKLWRDPKKPKTIHAEQV